MSDRESSGPGHETRTATSPGVAGSLGGPQPGEVLAGRFELERELGRGGGGIVFVAHDKVLNQRVAVKVIRAELGTASGIERLRREVRAAREPHPNQVTVYDFHTDGELSFLAMELVEGESLREQLGSAGPLPVEKVRAIGRKVAEALAHLHGLGLVHRDVKPANILLGEDGLVKLCDMGLVRPLQQGVTITETAMVVGTPTYMSPEQAAGEELDPASDVYSLGLALWRALTGEVPLTGKSAVATALVRRKSRVPRLRPLRGDCPRWLERLLRRMLDPVPRERPTAGQVAEALARGRSPWVPRRRHLLAASAVVVLAVAGGLGWQWTSRGPTVRVDVLSREVRGLDARGRVTWRYDFPLGISQHLQDDLDGDGAPETVVMTFSYRQVYQRSQRLPDGELAVIDHDGRMMLRTTVAEHISNWDTDYPKTVEARVWLTDVDGDGLPELVVAANQQTFYPSALLVCWPRSGRWRQLLFHDGWIYELVCFRQNGGERLRFLARANRLGMTWVVGELELRPGEVSHPVDRDASAVAEEGRFSDSSLVYWMSYTIVGWSESPRATDSVRGIELTGDGGSLVTLPGARRRLDRWGNPVPGPNAGHDLRALRLLFRRRLASLQWRGTVPVRLGADRGASVDDLARECRPLFTERPYRAVLALATACTLARAGDPLAGRERLAAEVEDAPWPDLILRLANLEAITGDLETASRRLERTIQESEGPRAGFDLPILLARIAIEQGSEKNLRRSRLDTARTISGDYAAALWARARLWWDESTEPDAAVRSSAVEPAGEAIACLVRWRLGRTAPDDPELMEKSLELNPDAAAEIRLARGAALLGLGRSGEALGVLDQVVRSLELPARDDFAVHQVYQLATAVRLKALAASGKQETAREEAHRILPTLTPGLLPALLVREVLDGS